jgi:hypothetical protein
LKSWEKKLDHVTMTLVAPPMCTRSRRARRDGALPMRAASAARTG